MQIDGKVYRFTICEDFVHILIFIVTMPGQVWLDINAGICLDHFIAVIKPGKSGA